MIELKLPWPPSQNHYWRFVPFRRGVRVLVSREARAYRREVCALLANEPRRSLDGRLYARVVLHPPTRRSWDLDNRIKCLLDTLQHAGVYHDDAQIDELHVRRGHVIKGGLAVVKIEQMHG